MPPRTLRRTELWTGLECDGGTRLGFLERARDHVEEREVAAGWRLSLDLPRASNRWDDVKEDRVVRTVFADGQGGEDWDEWRIRTWDKRRRQDNSATSSLVCDSVRNDLVANAAMLERVEVTGQTNRHFEQYQLSPTEHMTIIMEAAPSYFSIGTVELTDPVDMIYHFDTPLSALEELAKVTGGELQVRRNGTSGYFVDLVQQVGASADTVTIRRAGNLVEGSKKTDSSSIGTRIYPQGGNSFGREGTMAHAEWRVQGQSGATLTMEQELIGEADQLNGLYAEDQDGVQHEIADSSPPRTLVLASNPGKTLTGTFLKISRLVGSTFADLSFLESPSGRQEFGLKTAILERPDIPAVDNLLDNPAFRDWQGGTPRRWRAVGSPQITRNTDPLYTRHGGSSVLIQAAEGEGLESAATFVRPTAEQPFFVTQAALLPVEGHARLELIDETNDTVFPPPEEGEAVTVAQGEWIESFGVAPGGTPNDNFFTRETSLMRVRLIAAGGPLQAYWDIAQLTQNSSFEEVFYVGRASNDLWLLAKEALKLVTSPAESYRIRPIDRQRLDPEQYEGEEFVLGGDVRVVDDELGIDFTTRVLKVKRELATEGHAELTLEEKTNDLTKLLGATHRRNRKPLVTEEGAEQIPQDCTNLMAEGTDYGEFCSGDGSGREVITRYPPIRLSEAELQPGDPIAWGWDGKRTLTGTQLPGGDPAPGGETNPSQTLKRTGSGLLLDEGFGDPSVLGSRWITREGVWSIPTAPSASGRVVAINAATVGTPQPSHVLELDVSGIGGLPDADLAVQASYALSQHARLSLFARWSWGGGSQDGYGAEAGVPNPDREHRLLKLDAGAESSLATDPLDLQDRDLVTAKLALDGAAQEAWWTSAAGDVALSAADGAIAGPGTIALWARLEAGSGTENITWASVDSVLVCASNAITVNGLPTGWRVSVNDEAFADATTESGGTAVHDLGKELMGAGGKVVVWDDGGAQKATLSPAGGFYGGDTYQFDTSTAPTAGAPDPTVSFATATTASFQAQHDASLDVAAGDTVLLAFVTYDGGVIQSDPTGSNGVVQIDPGGASQADFSEVARSEVNGHVSAWVLRGADVPGAGTYTVRLTTDGNGEGQLHVMAVANAADEVPEITVATFTTQATEGVTRDVAVKTPGGLLVDALLVLSASVTTALPGFDQTQLTQDNISGAFGTTSWERETSAGDLQPGVEQLGWSWTGAALAEYLVIGLKPASQGTQTGTSSFDVGASLEVSFVDETGAEILNSEDIVEPVRTDDYTRGSATMQVPAGTVQIVPYGLRKGDGGPAVACIRRPQLNRGTVACEFREEVGFDWRVPTDEDLVLYYPLDEEGFVEPYQDGWLGSTAIVLSRRLWDASGRENHGVIWGTDSIGSFGGLMQREGRGASYLAVEHPAEWDVTIPHGQIIVDRDPAGNFAGIPGTPVEDAPDLRPMDDLTVSMWLNPHLVDFGGGGTFELPNETGDGSYLFGRHEGQDFTADGVQYVRAGFFLSLVDGAGVGTSFSTNDDLPGFGMIAEGAGNTWTMFWPFDWFFGMDLIPTADGFSFFLEQPIFIALRISPVLGGRVDVDVFCGRGDRSALVRMSPSLDATGSFGAADVLPTAYGAPAIKEHLPNGATRWQWMERGHRYSHYNNGYRNSQGTTGRYDELRRYNRALTDEEIRGLYLDPSATTGIFRQVGQQVASASGSPATNPTVGGLRLPVLVVDTCAGGTGLDVTSEWDPPAGATAATHEIRIQYFEDGIANGGQYTGIDPEARTHTHNLAGVGSDAGSPTSHDWHYEVELHEVGGGLVDSHTSAENDISYGTC